MNNGENLRFEVGTIPNPEARERARLFNMIPANLSREDRLAATVHLLNTLNLARDDSALQGMLPGFSANEINNAKQRAKRALREEKSDLGGIIRNVTARMTGERERTHEAMEKGFDMETLSKLVKKHFGLDSTKKRVYTREDKLARMAVAFIAQELGENGKEIAATLLDISPLTVDMLLKEAREEYAARLTFYRRVHDICRDAGIPAP